MKKAIVIIVLVFLGLQHGYRYIQSDKFQAWADENKSPWTCKVNLILAEIKIISSDYSRAIYFLEGIKSRCPKGNLIEEVDFKLASCTEKDGHWRDAVQLYLAFAEKYPDTGRAKQALRRASTLRSQLSN